MSPLTAERCLLHPRREAAARCAKCRQFFCRECATEHQGLIFCGACLKSAIELRGEGRRALRAVAGWSAAGGGVILTCLLFYLFGRIVLAMVVPG